ncbi:MAG TPA: glycosyltransferase family 2 protein [Candidatus Limnocylindrales bacterium]|nr:glycosyltransferase family 2 protein [Candidatus Limnocylindrales bacterium]
MRLILALAGSLLAWTYAVFPALLLARSRVRRRPYAVADIEPSVSVLIAAHDEERSIGARLANLRSLDYPADKLEIVLASDGSSDRTVAFARAADPSARVLDLQRVGKAAALGAAVSHSRGEILVFTDANSSYDRDAIRQLVRPFADPSVGGVAGNQVYLPAGSAEGSAAGERGYWSFDRIMKTAESEAGSVVSATGAIYAIRRELFRPIPDAVTDDFHQTLAVVGAGRRFVFAPAAIAWEPVAASSGAEFERKVRVMVRGLRCVAIWRELLDPRRSGFFALELATRKVLMRTMALPLAALFAASLGLAGRSRVARAFALTQATGYGLGIAGLALERRAERAPRLLALPGYFCLVQAASLTATWRLLRGDRVDRWQPARGAGPSVERFE